MDNFDKAETAAELAAQAAGNVADSGVLNQADTANTRKAGFWAGVLAGFLGVIKSLRGK